MATSIIKVHTLSGAGDGGPPCYIVQVDEFHCLLDCGWSDGLDKEYVKRLTQWTRHIDAVLLSHQSLRHLGLLPFLVGSCGLKCPVYATTPVYKMGQLTLYDFYQSMYASEDFTAFTLDDVDAAFDLVVQVKYQQTINLPGRGRGLCITPLPSGHTLGGTIWKLVKEDTDIVYAVDFNHKKERHLNGATFDACMRPHLLIMDASNTMYTHPRRKDRDETLRHCILKTLRRGGNILVAVDTAGRCLEVAHFLEQCWLNQDSGMMAYGLAMLSFVAFNVVDFAKSMVEWMSEKVMRTFEDQRTNPFHFRHVQLCHTLEQLDTVPEPKVVLASASDLSCGFARQLFAEWADSDLNTVILTSRESCVVNEEHGGYTLLGRLIGLARGDAAARQGLPTSSTGTLVLPLSLSQRVSQAQYEQLKNELPRIRNAVQVGSTTLPSGASSSGALDVGAAIIPMPEGMDESGNTPADDQNTDTDERIIASVVQSSRVAGQVFRLSTTSDVNMDGGTSPPPPSAPFTLTTVQHTEHETSLLGLTGNSAHQPPTPSRRNNTLLNVDPLVDHHQSSQLTMPSGTQLTVGRHQPGYDIYPGLHNHAGGQFFRMTKRTQLLFPQVDRKIHWDEYGGHVDRDLFNAEDKHDSNTCTELKQKSQKVSQPILEDTAPSSLISPSILECLASRNFQFDDPETKTHVITHQLEIPLRCELLFLDYEGRSDGEAMKRIVVGLRPQELILVGNSRTDTEQLAAYCRTVMLLASNLVHTPSACSVINCTKEGDIYQARMKDSLVSSLRFTKIRDYELAWVEANIDLTDNASSDPDHSESTSDNPDVPDASGDDNPPSPLKTRSSLAADRLPVLGLPTGPVGAHKTVFVNEPKLSDLKQLLLANGLVAEFVSGVLVVDNCVAIKRSEAGKLLLEGLLSRTYFTVRQVLYQQFAILHPKGARIGSIFSKGILVRCTLVSARYSMNCTVDGITDEVYRLVSKLEKRELGLDALRDSILEIQAPFAGQHRCQEDSLTFEELSKRVETHPRGWLILCLAAENKELEQLQVENKSLLDSLDKHQSALDLIMKKYRLQVSQLIQTNRMEKLISTYGSRLENIVKGSTNTLHLKSDNIFSDERLVRAEPISNRGRKDDEGSNTNELTTAMLSARVSTLASMARDVCSSGDLYTTQLEAELHRLRSENAGLRELLTISSDFAVDPTDVTENAPSSDRALSGSSSAQPAHRVDLSVLPPNQNSSNVGLQHPSKLTNLVRALDEFIPYNTAERGRSPSDPSSGRSEDDNDDYDDDVTVADGSESSD